MASIDNFALQPTTGGAGSETNEFGVKYGSSTFAADTQAGITRANWARSRGQLRPLIDRLNYTYFNPTGRQEAVQGAAALALDGVQQAQQQFGRESRSIGMALAPDQQAEVDRQFASVSNVAKLDAMNRASRGYDDLKNQIALG